MWKGKCHKCGRDIWNDIPEDEMAKVNHDTSAFIAKMKAEGFELGYNSTMVGSYGNMHEVPCNPVCGICIQEEHDRKYQEENKKLLIKITKIIEKVYSCPICENSVQQGYNEKVFKCAKRAEMMGHIKAKHDNKAIRNTIPSENIKD
jgi:hypothetical protein